MKFTSNDKQERLKQVHEYYSKAVTGADPQRIKFKKYEDQYLGTHEIDDQTVDDEGESVDTPKSTPVVWNISFELLEATIDVELPQPAVTPDISSEHHVRNSRRIERLVKRLMDKQPLERYNDEQERTVKKFGTAAFNIEWDVNVGTHSTVGEVQLTPLRPQNIYPQPAISSIDDCDYVFVNYITTRDALMRRYSLTEEDVEHTEFSADYDGEDNTSANDDVVTLTVMWYRNERGDICRFAYSGDLVLEDDDDYYSRKVQFCKSCGRRRQLCEKSPCENPKYYLNKLDWDELTEDIKCSDGRIIPAWTPVFEDGKPVYETVKMPVTNADGSQALRNIGGAGLPAFVEVQIPKMQKTRLPYYKPQKYPLAVRYNIKSDDGFWGISDMQIIREHQQECNKLTGRIHEAVMKAGSALIKPEKSDVVLGNGIFDNIIELKDSMDKNQFGQFSYAADISQWLIERNNHKEQAKKLLGITDSYLGQADTTAKSGYAKSVQVAQSTGRLASKKVLKQSHYTDIFRVFFELYLAFADEPRAIMSSNEEDTSYGYTDAGDRFNRYDYYEFDTKTGEWYIDDNYSFAVDPNGAFEQQYVQLWEVVKSDYAAGLYGSPDSIDTQIAAWQHLERLRYPFARNIVEMKKRQKEQMLAAQAQQPAMPDASSGQGMNSQTPCNAAEPNQAQEGAIANG